MPITTDDVTTILLVANIQAGLLLVGYMAYLRWKDLASQLATLRASSEIAARACEVQIDSLQSRLDPSRPAGAQARFSPGRPVGGQALQMAAARLAATGQNPTSIARALDRRPAEIDLLLKVEQYRAQRRTGPASEPSTEGG